MPADVYDGPFGGYSDVSLVVVGGSQTRIQEEIAKLKALLPDITAGVSAPHPDFDDIAPHTAVKFRAEIDAMAAAIGNAPTA